MEKTFEELGQSLVTVTQRDYFLNSLEVLASSLYSSHQTIYELTSMALSFPFSGILVRMYHEQNLIENDKDRCRDIINAIKKEINLLETVEIRVAYNVTEADVKDIRNWFLYQLKKHILLNIIVDPSLVGGIVIYRNGKYKDYSVASYIDHYGRI